ncbi:radical SAM domain-containing protein, partial [Rhodococcus wratislaviensis IFP 2016]
MDNTPAAFSSLRTSSDFLDPDRHNLARRTLAAGLSLVSAANRRVEYTIRGADYRVAGVDREKLGDLIEVTSSPRYNLFEDLYADVITDLLADRPDLVGISILNRQQIIPGLTLARRCREAGLVVVLGGTVYAKFHDQLTERVLFFDTFCDGLVPYEGETAMRALAETIENGRNPTQWGAIPNLLSVNANGDVVSGPTYAEDIRRLPTPDFDGLPLDAYLNPVRVLPILTGKGCYFNRCKFCDIPYINRITKPYRVREPQQIATDIATLHRRYGARHFEITDETLSPKLLTRVADALDDHPDIHPRFVGYARFEPGFTQEACQRIYEMGVRKLFFGLESGNQEMLNNMNKGIHVDVAHRVLRNCAEAGIGVHVFSIVGFPEESEVQ